MKAAFEPTFALLASKGADSVGAIGFCWGAYPVFQFSSDGLIKAGVSCHPSLKIGAGHPLVHGRSTGSFN